MRLLFAPCAAMITLLPSAAIVGAENVVPLAATCSACQLVVPYWFQKKYRPSFGV